MSQESPLSGLAVVVAGGGRGIGRAAAELMAAEGAWVLIADPGVEPTGSSGQASLAESVAAAIRKNGGDAIGIDQAIGDRVAGERLVEACLDSFGRFDSLVLPAALLRDRMIFNQTEEDWELLLRVNLSGVFWAMRAASRHMRENGFGRIVTFTSGAGLEGRAGTANYAATKMGVVGLTKTVAKDLAKYGVQANCIAPRASTRLSQHVAETRPGFAEPLHKESLGEPERIAPLCAYLAGRRCAPNGKVFFCSGTHIGIYPEFLPHRIARMPETLSTGYIAEIVDGYLDADGISL